MVEFIPSNDRWGKIGRGFGQGLAEQVPKEIERSRLASGLKNLGQKKGLTPFQQLAEFYSIPGAADRPQLIQSGTEFLRQQAQAQAMQDQAQNMNRPQEPQPSPFANISSGGGSSIPSITKEEPLAQIQEGYIPATQEEIMAEAGKLYNANPALYNNDPNKAIEAAKEADQRRQNIQQAYLQQHENLTKLQDNVVNRLKEHSNNLGVKIPANVYSKIEDEAIQATKSKKDGGRGLTEQAAMKEYGKKLDEISREYSNIDAVGNWAITARPAKNTISSIKSNQENFRKRDDLENYSDLLVSKNKFSPKYAKSLAYPVWQYPEINKELSKIEPFKFKSKPVPGAGFVPKVEMPKKADIYNKTLEISQKLASKLGEASPLAVAYELEKKGYDPQAWKDYLLQNRNNLKLKEWQGRELDKPLNLLDTINDWWLQSWSGIE